MQTYSNSKTINIKNTIIKQKEIKSAKACIKDVFLDINNRIMNKQEIVIF